MNTQGRGFEGFYTIRTNDSRTIDGYNQYSEYKYYDRAFPYTMMMNADLITNNSEDLKEWLGSLTYTTLDATAHNQRYFPYFSNTTQYQWEPNEAYGLVTTSSTNYTYDNYGNATQVASTVTDNDAGSPYEGDYWTTTTTNTPDVDTTNWCLNLFTETQVAYTATAGLGNAVTRTKTFTPDTTKCRYTQMVTEPTANSGLYKVTETPGYDTTVGNILTDTLVGAHVPAPTPASRETQFTWSSNGQFPSTVEDPSGATSTLTYTSNQALMFGVPDSAQDANNLTTSWTYDSLGRKAKETRPDGTSTTWASSACTTNCGFSNSVYEVTQTAFQTNGTTAIRVDTTAFDPMERVTQTAGPNVSGATVTVQRLYNSLGLLVDQSLPFTSGTAYQVSYAYDALNRMIETQRPVNSSGPNSCNPATLPPASGCQGTAYSYIGRKTNVTDANGNLSTLVHDVNGWLRITTDAVGTGYKVTRAYDAAGSLTGVTDNLSNTLLKNVTVVYGLQPFLTAATDADLGGWAYTLDSFGERTSWSDAKGQSFSMTYDALSRPLTRTEPDLFTQWTWGSIPAKHEVGQLVGECTGTGTSCGSGYSENRAFTPLGQLYTRSITLFGVTGNDPGGSFLYTNVYDSSTELLSTLTYPISTSGAAFKLQYGYNKGLLQTVTDTLDTTATCGSTCVLWTANAADGFGHITTETLGNNVVDVRTYDPVTSWLTKATAGVGGGMGLLNQSYAQDKNGNVFQRQDNNLGLTESFAYDADNRITCAALSSTCTSTSFAYDGGSPGPGNITSQTGVGTYTYPAVGQPHPHAVTSISGTVLGVTNPSFAYDANGNMTARAGSSIAWASSNYPTDIAAPDGEEVQFSYGPDRQRWKQTYTSSNPTEYTYYVGGLLEVVITGGVATYRHYVRAGSEPVALYSRSGSTVAMSYVLSDHLGSVAGIASSTGTVNPTDSFSAFGQLRNSTTWSGSPTSSQLNGLSSQTRQGYTFQTWLGQSMGLNHMNGRVQDAVLGRFLSPDPVPQDPANAQSYNRYTYVGNNPLTQTDPSGFVPCELCGGGDDSGNGGANGGGDGETPELPPVVVPCTVCCGSNSGCWSVNLPPPIDLNIPPPNISLGLGGGGLPSGATTKPSTPAKKPNPQPCLSALRTAGQNQGAINRALSNWPTVSAAAAANGIDPALLASIGVRESGFQNVSQSGGGMGAGVFQIDLGANPDVTAAQAFNVPFAANYAAGMLASNAAYLGANFPNFTAGQLLQATAASYNFGVGNISGNPNTIDVGSTGNNYGSNVVGLMSCFVH